MKQSTLKPKTQLHQMSGMEDEDFEQFCVLLEEIARSHTHSAERYYEALLACMRECARKAVEELFES